MMMTEEDKQKKQSSHNYSQLYMQKMIQKEQMTLFRDMISIFKALQGNRYEIVLHIYQFRKIWQYPLMNNEKFGVAAYNKIFDQVASNGTMSFYEFITAMEMVVSNLFPEDFTINKI